MDWTALKRLAKSSGIDFDKAADEEIISRLVKHAQKGELKIYRVEGGEYALDGKTVSKFAIEGCAVDGDDSVTTSTLVHGKTLSPLMEIVLERIQNADDNEGKTD